MTITATIRRLFTREAPRPRVLVAVSTNPSVTLDSQVPKVCRIPIYYENNRDASYEGVPIIAANPANEYYANPQGRDAAIAFLGKIRDTVPVKQQVVLYGSPATQWSRWDDPTRAGFARGEVATHAHIAAESGCAFGPSMYFMGVDPNWKDKHYQNVDVVRHAGTVYKMTYGLSSSPPVFPFVCPFYGGRCEDGWRQPVPVDKTKWLLDMLIEKDWTPIIWAHAYHNEAMRQIRGELYQLREYMR